MKADEPEVGPIERRKVYELVAQRLIDEEHPWDRYSSPPRQSTC